MSEPSMVIDLATLCATGDLSPLQEAVAHCENDVVHLDASGLNTLTSTALHITLSTLKSCADAGGRAELADASQDLLEGFSQAGVEITELMSEAAK